MLHGVGGRRRPGGLRDARPPGRRPPRDHPRGTRSRGTRGLGRGVHRDGGEPVRFLHPGDRHAPGGPGPAVDGGRRERRPDGAAGPSVPVHGLVQHPRGGPPRLRGADAGHRRATRSRRRRPPGRDRGRRPPGGRAPCRPRGRRVRRRHGPAGRPRRRPRRSRRLGRGRDAPRGPGPGGEGAGTELDGGRRASAGGGARRVRPDAADDVHRAGLPGARRLVVPAGGGARQPAGQRGRLRGEARLAGGRRGAVGWPTSTVGASGS